MPPDSKKHKLRWVGSYETVLFDTPDGDLDKNQYAIAPHGGWYVRLHPKNNHNITHTNDAEMVKGKKKVSIADQKGAYYDEFELPDGRKLRQPSNRTAYRALGTQRRAPQPQKEVDDAEVIEIEKDDPLWRE